MMRITHSKNVLFILQPPISQSTHELFIRRILGQKVSIYQVNYNSLKDKGLVKGTINNPKFAWKIKGILNLAKKYPFLNFEIKDLKHGMGCEVFNSDDDSGFYFRNKNQFYFHILSDGFMFHNPGFLRVLDKPTLESLIKQTNNFQVYLDQALENCARQTSSTKVE